MVTGADSYELQVVALDGLWVFNETGITATTGRALVTVPLAGLQPQVAYQARARGVAAGVASAWSTTVTLVPLDLTTTTLGFTWPDGGSLTAQWLPVDQAQTYQAALTQDSTTTTSYPTGQTLTLANTMVTGTDVVTLQVRGSTAPQAGGSGALNAANALGSTAKTALGFYFQDPDSTGNGNFAFDWTTTSPASAFFYMEVSKNGTLVTSGHVAGSATPPALLAAPSPAATGEQYVGRMRRIDAGVLAEWDSQTVTIHSLSAPAPVVQAAVPPATESLTLAWGSVATGATYNLDVYVDGSSQPQEYPNVTSPYSLMPWVQGTSATSNHAYTYRLRALLDGELGPPNPVGAPRTLATAFQYVWNGGQDAGTLAAFS